MCPALPQPGARHVADDFGRLLELTGARPLRSQLIHRGITLRPAACGTRDPLGPSWYRLADDDVEPIIAGIPARARVVNNSNYARSFNDGALWAGRGLAGGIEGGLRFRYGVLSGVLAPALYYSQNREFAVPSPNDGDLSRFAYPWHGRRIDLPLRHGDDSFTRLGAGQSVLRADAHGAKIGVSNENLWWGPALHNPLLFSNTAPGFPHLFAGTSAPADIFIGRLEGEAFWGVLSESDYYDTDPDNDERLLAGVILAFQPRGVDGLFLGAARTYMTTLTDDWGVGDFFLEPYRGGGDDPLAGQSDSQMLALYLRWALPRSGFEAYAEWARADDVFDAGDLLNEPEHTQAYTLGFQKVIERRDEAGRAHRWLRLYGELTRLQAALPAGQRGIVPFYTQTSAGQGHTQRGQPLGAGIGPGSNAQIIGADLFTRRGRIGAYIQRIRYDDDAYFANYAGIWAHNGHDAELTGGLRALLVRGDVEARAELTFSYRFNRDYLIFEYPGLAAQFIEESNVGIEVGFAWRPPMSWTLEPAPALGTARLGVRRDR